MEPVGGGLTAVVDIRWPVPVAAATQTTQLLAMARRMAAFTEGTCS